MGVGVMTAAAQKRIELRVDEETKLLAERASAVQGTSVTDYMTRLIRENAPAILKEHSEIQLTNAQFDNFMVMCNDDRKPSPRMASVMKRLREDGF